MTRVLMLVSNAHAPDVRVDRAARALTEVGYTVRVLAWDRRAELPRHEHRGGAEIQRVHSVPSEHLLGWRQLPRFVAFWREALRASVAFEPQVVHCHDLDTLWAGSRIKRSRGARLVFDAHEDYPARMAAYLPRPVCSALAVLERVLCARADAIVSASPSLAEVYRARGLHPVVTVGNHPDPSRFAPLGAVERAAIRARLEVPEDALLVGYVGGLSRNRALVPLIEAVASMAGVELRIWGDGAQREAVARAAAAAENARYEGWLDPSCVPAHTGALDVAWYGLWPDQPGAEHNASNGIGQAMAAGVPVLAVDVGDLACTLREADAGLLIAAPQPTRIVAALERLRDPELRGALGSRGRAAVEGGLDERTAARELQSLYATLVGLPRGA